tara:strand:+ start:187 stop:450 length:264 start_codon:yes stop_codon:yes gene_type:complete
MNNNKLIAEFMGIKSTNGLVFQDANTKEFHAINYHTSWDWLMPVIEEIDHLQQEPVQSIEDALATRCIGDTYNAVVEFIKQYNDGQG